jgi:hypothetical protein
LQRNQLPVCAEIHSRIPPKSTAGLLRPVQVDPRRDDIGLLLDAERLPKRVRPKKVTTGL